MMPLFFLDVGLNLYKSDSVHGLQVLSNLAEIDLENPQYLRVLVYTMSIVSDDECEEIIVSILRKLCKLRSEEPQQKRELAQYLITRAIRSYMEKFRGDDVDDDQIDSKVLSYFKEAIEIFKDIIFGKWDVRFDQIEVTTLMDLSRLFNYLNAYGYLHKLSNVIDTRIIPKASMGIDLRIEIQWDTDLTDVELHIQEPTGEVCYSFNNKTKIGGMLSKDFTAGFGPEEYLLRKAIQGTYKVSVKLFGQRRENYMGTTVQVKINMFYGSPEKEKISNYVVRLSKVKEKIHVADVIFK